MKRLAKNAIVVASSELKYGWTFQKQARFNPDSKKKLPDVRKEMARAAYHHRTNTWVNRFRKSRKPSALDAAKFSLGKEGV